MMRLIESNSAVQANNRSCHANTMKITQSTFHLQQKYGLEIRPTTPKPLSDCHAMSIDSPMTVSPVSNKATQRRVRFAIPTSDINDISDVNELRNIFDDVDCMMTADDDWNSEESCAENVVPSDIYWDRNDMKKNRLYAQRKAMIIRNKYPQEVEALENVIIQCCRHGEATRRQHQQNERPNNKGNLFTIISTEVTTMHNWSSSYVRGLEDYMTPILTEKRSTVMVHILQYQTFLQEQSPPLPHLDISNRLSAYSRKLSQPSRDFALKLAIGDALAASCDP